jgi:hypothetical protein
MEKKGSGKLRVCIDFCNLNRATPNDEYPMPISDILIHNTSGNRVISFLDGSAKYNLIFMVKEDASCNTLNLGYKISSQVSTKFRC